MENRLMIGAQMPIAQADANYEARRSKVEAEVARLKLEMDLRRPGGIIHHPPTAADCSTPDLVMEMLKRSYAVIKMPEDGGLPDVLK